MSGLVGQPEALRAGHRLLPRLTPALAVHPARPHQRRSVETQDRCRNRLYAWKNQPDVPRASSSSTRGSVRGCGGRRTTTVPSSTRSSGCEGDGEQGGLADPDARSASTTSPTCHREDRSRRARRQHPCRLRTPSTRSSGTTAVVAVRRADSRRPNPAHAAASATAHRRTTRSAPSSRLWRTAPPQRRGVVEVRARPRLRRPHRLHQEPERRHQRDLLCSEHEVVEQQQHHPADALRRHRPVRMVSHTSTPTPARAEHLARYADMIMQTRTTSTSRRTDASAPSRSPRNGAVGTPCSRSAGKPKPTQPSTTSSVGTPRKYGVGDREQLQRHQPGRRRPPGPPRPAPRRRARPPRPRGTA